jgi:hypothetical protein
MIGPTDLHPSPAPHFMSTIKKIPKTKRNFHPQAQIQKKLEIGGRCITCLTILKKVAFSPKHVHAPIKLHGAVT